MSQTWLLFSNYKINFIPHLHILPFLSFFWCFFSSFFWTLVRFFLWETLQAWAALQAASQTKLFLFFALRPAISPSPPSALFTSSLHFFFPSHKPGRKWKKKKCLFLVPGQSGSNLFLFPVFTSHPQCSHLLSQGNAVTGTFAQAVVIWPEERETETER